MHNPYEASAAASLLHERERPTYVRYGVLAWLCSLAMLLYADRVAIGQAATAIRESLGLEIDQWSWVNNAFIIAYGIFEVPAGHWGDRYGSRGVIARIVIAWSIFTALTGAGFDLWSLVVIRFLFGMGEAGAFPNAARVVTHWFPPAERGLARGAITTTSLLAAALVQPIVPFLVRNIGWRAMFGLFGTIGVVWAVAFYWWFRDDPAEHPAANRAEVDHIGKPPKHEQAHPSIDWIQVLTSANVWLLGAIMMVSATLFYMQFQWFPTYLEQARNLTKQQAGNLTGIVIGGGAIGCIVGGLFSDYLIRHTTDRKWSRRWCGLVTLMLSALSLWGVRNCEWAITASLCNAAALFFLQLSIPTWWTVVAEISGRNGAAMWGLMNSVGGLGVFGMTFLVGWVVKMREEAGLSKIDCWRPVFDGVALGMAFGALCWLFVDATKPIMREASDKPADA